MKSRTVWIALGLLAAIAAATIAVLIINLDAFLDSQRPWLEETASDLLAREVSAKRVTSSFWGGIGVRVEDLVIAEDPAHSKQPFLVADSLEVHLGLLEALRGEVEIRSASLIAPVVRLRESRRGWNFESLGEDSQDAAKPDDSSDDGPDPIHLELLRIERGTLYYTNSTESPAYTIVAKQVELEARDWAPGAPFEFAAKAILTGADTHDLHVNATLRPQPKAATGLELELKGIALDSAKLATFPPIARVLPPDLSVSGPLHATLSAKGDVGAFDFTGGLDIEQLGFDTLLLHRSAGKPMKVAFRGNSNAAAIEIAEFALTGLGSTLAGQGSLRRSDPGILEFTASSTEIALSAFGLQAAGDGEEQGEARSDEAVDLTEALTNAPAETLKEVTASGQITLVESDPPVGKLALHSTSGFVRRLAYRDLSIDADLRTEGPFVTIRSPSGTVERLNYDALHIEMNLEHDQLTIDDARAQVLGGELRARGHTRVDPDAERQSRLQLRMDGISAKALDTLLRPGEKRSIEGKLTLRLRLEGLGSNLDRLRESLVGNVALTIEEGVLHDVKLSDGAIDALKTVPGVAALFRKRAEENAPDLLPDSGTPFETIEIKAQIADGVARTEKINIVSPAYTISGQGSVTLLGVVDARGTLTFSQTFLKRLGGTGQLLRGLLNPSGLIAIPVRLVGTLPDIETKADPAYVARALRDGLIMGTVGGVLGGANKLLGRPAQQAAPPFELELGRAPAPPTAASEAEPAPESASQPASEPATP